ncbi:MAG TPA: hypothetical protein VND62_05760 [Acidimicrobiales bacterium]|nr:hypothetical protein [Acidimicrobiales bacterium]
MGEPTRGPHRIEDRLRKALGESGPGARGSASARGSDAVRTQVLAGIRQRRLRRLQLTGVAAVVAVGLAVTLPQALGSPSSPSSSGRQGRAAAGTGLPASSSASGVPAFGTSQGGAQSGSSAGTPAHAASPVAPAHCRATAQVNRACGTIATGAAAPRLVTAAVSLERAVNAKRMVTMAPAVGSPRIPSLGVRAGGSVTVELPVLPGGWRWSAPAIAGGPVYHGTGPPVRVRAAGGGARRFVVTTRVAVTVVLEALAKHAPTSASTAIEPATVWALELKVEGK